MASSVPEESAGLSSPDRDHALDEIVTCPVCFEHYTDPRALPCLHTFCLKCLDALCRGKRPLEELPCPMCRTNFKIPEGGLQRLPVNFWMRMMMDTRLPGIDDAAEAPPRITKQFNILLLGQTGVGKSTWIDGLANYVKYASLDEAENDGGTFPIPLRFKSTVDKRVISTGDDPNEQPEAGQPGQGSYGSATQLPIEHVFYHRNFAVRVIDTPGIGDTRGKQKDATNVENILRILSGVRVLHAICILFRSKECRLTETFRYCITELLRNLYDSARQNVVICFTNAKDADYTGGDTHDMIAEFFDANEKLRDINDQNNLFCCIENEPVRYLAEHRCGVVHPPFKRDSARRSWEFSVDATFRMLSHVQSLKPHDVADTLSLNNARQTIEAVAGPLAEIVRATLYAIDSLNAVPPAGRRGDAEKTTVGVRELEIRFKVLDRPALLCRSAECVGRHRLCYDGVGYWQWFVMRYFLFNTCRKCRCRLSNHDFVTSLPVVTEKTSTVDVRDIARLRKTRLRERECVVRATARLSAFLRANAICDGDDGDEVTATQTDVVSRMLRDVARMQPLPAGDERKRLEYSAALKDELKGIADEVKRATDEIMSRGDATLGPAEVGRILDEMYNGLPLSSEMLRTAVELKQNENRRWFENDRRVKFWHLERIAALDVAQ